MKLEDEVQAEIQIEGPKLGVSLMRNNSGALKDKTGRTVRYGLGNVSERINETIKSSDLIGPTTITITQEMVGKKIAVFSAIEVKREGWHFPDNPSKREIAQNNFIELTKVRGGIAGFASSVAEFRGIVETYIARLKT